MALRALEPVVDRVSRAVGSVEPEVAKLGGTQIAQVNVRW